ncbi:MAG: helix-turn-helix domain-containing protein [Syntrophaceae bacterium]
MLEVGLHLFSQKGFYCTSVEDIVREAGVGKGTFYRYFKSKEDIFVAILTQFLTEWGSSALIGVDKVKPDYYLDYVNDVAQRSFQFFTKNYELSNLYSRIAPGLNEFVEPYLQSFEELMLGYLIQDLKKAQVMGYLEKKLNVKLAANIISGAFFRVIYYYFLLKNEDRERISLNDIINDFVRIVFDGIMQKKV